MKSNTELAPRSIGVKNIPTEELIPNPHNPRLLFDREPLEVLKASIAKVGILVPLTVYYDSRKNRFVILDGQRRWTCACQLSLNEVPVNEVAEPTLVQNIVTMFQIHKLREDWELMPTALKLELLMTELGERGDRKLAELTGLDAAVVSRCKKLLSYPKKYQDRMIEGNPQNRVKADFFIELYAVKTDRNVKKFPWFKPDDFTKRMLSRYENRKLRSVTDFRVVKQHINNAAKAGKLSNISDRLERFTLDDSITVDFLEIDSASASAEAKSIEKAAVKICETIAEIDLEAMVGEEKLWKALEKLMLEIRSTLEGLGRRLPR